MRPIFHLLCTAAFFFISCTEKDKNGKVPSTPTSGKITIVADESLRPIVEAEVETFNAIYKKANISVVYLPEAEAISAMMNVDTIKVGVLARRFNADEKKYFMDKWKIRAREEDVAISAIAVILHPQNPDTLLSINQLKKVLNQDNSTWRDLGGNSNDGIEIVFDNANSSLIRHLKDSIAKVDKLPANCFALKDNRQVVEHVAKNKNALGLIGLEWISDKDDTVTHTFLDKVKVAAIAGDSAHFQPYQAYLALKHYPLMRMISVVNCEGRSGLGSGFASFFAGPTGQRIVLKAGLVPKTMPLRIVEINQKPFEIEK